jgi:hypothetical protein
VHVDDSSKSNYFFNQVTKETSWDFPMASLSVKQRQADVAVTVTGDKLGIKMEVNTSFVSTLPGVNTAKPTLRRAFLAKWSGDVPPSPHLLHPCLLSPRPSLSD